MSAVPHSVSDDSSHSPRLRLPLLPRLHETQRGGEERDVRQRLREIAEQLAGMHVDLLGEQSDVVAAADDVVEERAGFIDAAGQRERFDEPEAAGEERAFAGWKAVVGLARVVAVDQAGMAEL